VGTEPVEYCRDLERYLCQKNDGHLIRIVGPSFERVASWASLGVPFKVACRGIDRYFERYYAKGPRRRPVRIDFCEADVLEVFDEWRRAVGLTAGAIGPTEAQSAPPATSGDRRPPALGTHLERALMRLTSARANNLIDARFEPLLDRVAHELDQVRQEPRGLRGEARRVVLERLDVLDREMLALAQESLGDADRAALTRDADDELSAFRASMPADAFARARANAFDRLLRDRFKLPILSLL
jgi:hypothetical protein